MDHLVPVIPVTIRSGNQDRPSGPHGIIVAVVGEVGTSAREKSGSFRRKSNKFVGDFVATDGDRGRDRDEDDYAGGDAIHGGFRREEWGMGGSGF